MWSADIITFTIPFDLNSICPLSFLCDRFLPITVVSFLGSALRSGIVVRGLAQSFELSPVLVLVSPSFLPQCAHTHTFSLSSTLAAYRNRITTVTFSPATKFPLSSRPKPCGQRHTIRPSLLGQCHKRAPPRKPRRSTLCAHVMNAPPPPPQSLVHVHVGKGCQCT